MTDLERFKELFNSVGIGYDLSVSYNGERTILSCNEGMAKVTGYSCFFTEFEFDKKTGAFIEMGAGE